MKQYLPILEKAIKEEYFRNFKDVDSYKNPSKLSITFVQNELFNNPEHNNLTKLYRDYTYCYFDINNPVYQSKLIFNILFDVIHYSQYIKNYDFNETTREVMHILNNISKESYLVGGCVRDILRNTKPKDFDFVTDIPYDKLKIIFGNLGFTVREHGKQFLVLVVEKNNESFEICNFRNESNYKDGRRPESVEIGDIYTDSQRRDFTCNSIYYSLSKQIIIDATAQGLNDIKNNILRFIGNPEDRIKEDFLRLWRYYRFLKTKNFNSDKKSLQACRRLFQEAILKTSSERIKNELENIVGV